jgi:rhodanese-related sulfurtransferase
MADQPVVAVSGVPGVDAREADRLRRQPDGVSRPPILVDVRELPEVVGVRAEDVVVLPLSQFARRYRELPADRPLLIICHVGERSAMATAYLVHNGYPLAASVLGGMVAWERAGLPVRRGPLAPGEGGLPRP